MADFFQYLTFFLAKQRVCKYQLILWPDLKKIVFHLKALQTMVLIDVINFFLAQVVPKIYAKTQVSKTARCVRVFLLLTVFFDKISPNVI